MSSFDIEKLFDKVVAEHAELFNALMEFEKTKRLPKLSYKTRVNFTLDHQLVKKLRDYCQQKGYKMSSLIEQLIKEKVYS